MASRVHALDRWRGRWQGYALALAGVATTGALRALFTPWLGDHAPYLLFFPVILLASVIGGTGPGIVALLAGDLVGTPLLSADIGQPAVIYSAGLFLLSGAGVVMVARQLLDWRGRAIENQITAARNAGRANEATRELALLVDGATNYAIYMLDPEGRVTIWNVGAERIKGWCEEEAVGLPCSTFYPPDEVAAGKPEADLARALAEGRIEEESWRLRKDGSEFLASVTITALFDEDGRHAGFGKVIRDITDQRAAASIIEAREMQLRSILATVPDAMIVIDDQGLIRSFSTTAERLFGYAERDVIGRNIGMLMPHPDQAAHDGYIDHYLKTGERRIIGTTRRVLGARKDGTTFPLELSIGEAVGGGQRLFTGFVRDLTEREETAKRLDDLQSELIHVSRLSAMGTMASTLAHELNQPLAAIANYVEASKMIIEQGTEDRALLVDALGEAASESFRAGNIVRRLREFVARGDLEKRVEDLETLVEQAASLGLAGARERSIDFEIDLARNLGPVLVDRVQIQQVLINLMRNAVEAMAANGGGALTVTARREGANAHVVLADDGPGLAEGMRERLFEAFQSTKPDGMGLGLSICRTIVEAHGGRIWATSPETGGTEFHFTIPRAELGDWDER